MAVHYKNKRINRVILRGVFLALAGLLWGVRDVSAGTEVKVGTESAGGVYFYNTESELDIYLTRNLYFKYGYTSDGIKKGGVTAVLDGATYIDGPYSEISRVIAPGVYNFRLTYSSPGTQSSDPIYWWAWVGYTNYQHTVYIYDQRISYVKITYGQTINGTITVSDVGQSIKLEAVSGSNQTFYSGIQFPQKLVARAIKSDGQLVSGKQVVFSLKSGPQFGQATFTNPSATTGSAGTVETFFTLTGPTYYPFTMKAYCADCPLQQEALFTETLAEKTNVLRKLPDGDNQTWLVGQTLPKQLSVKVVDYQNNPVDGADIQFSVSAPQQGDWSFPGNVKEITIKTTEGVAKTDFKLGTAAGEYTINADCAICAAGNNNVMFTEKAVTDKNIAMELRKISGDSTGWIGKEILNPFRVQAFNRVTGSGESGFNIEFKFLNMPQGSTGFSLNPESTATSKNKEGFAESHIVLGNLPGSYDVEAYCQQCLANQSGFLNITATSSPEILLGNDNPNDPMSSNNGGPSENESKKSSADSPQIQYKIRADSKLKLATRPDIRKIAVITGDTVMFESTLNTENQEWSGIKSGTGREIDVQFNQVGEYTETVSHIGNTAFAKIRVEPRPTTGMAEVWVYLNTGVAYCTTNFNDCVKMVFFYDYALAWALNLCRTTTCHNNACDAAKHMYWHATVTKNVNETLSEMLGEAHEYEAVGKGAHNEIVMDLLNNRSGRIIGKYANSDFELQLGIQQLIENGGAWVLHDPTNGERTPEYGLSLLEPSR